MFRIERMSFSQDHYKFGYYVDRIYLTEHEIKDTTYYSARSDLYIDIRQEIQSKTQAF
jgi:hypothetical protein